MRFDDLKLLGQKGEAEPGKMRPSPTRIKVCEVRELHSRALEKKVDRERWFWTAAGAPEAILRPHVSPT